MSDGENHRDDLFSKAVRAGKRTYFFDVKATKGNDLYMTITESKRRFTDDGKYHYEKHKLFLYKEDFDKFAEGLQETIERINALRQSGEFQDAEDHSDDYRDDEHEEHEGKVGTFTNVDFDDLED